MAKNFPARLFVKIEKDGDTEYFTADDEAAYLVDMGDKIKIATYALTSVATAEGVAKFIRAKSVRKSKT
jgi:hypothetical protein